MLNRVLARIAFGVLMAAALSRPSLAAVEDLPGMDTATDMKEWLKLTDDQVAKLQPVIATRITKVDAALAKVEAAEKPDAMGFISEYGAIKKEFNAGVTNILTPDQAKQWGAFKAELEKGIVQSGAKKQLAEMQTALEGVLTANAPTTSLAADATLGTVSTTELPRLSLTLPSTSPDVGATTATELRPLGVTRRRHAVSQARAMRLI